MRSSVSGSLAAWFGMMAKLMIGVPCRARALYYVILKNTIRDRRRFASFVRPRQHAGAFEVFAKQGRGDIPLAPLQPVEDFQMFAARCHDAVVTIGPVIIGKPPQPVLLLHGVVEMP